MTRLVVTADAEADTNDILGHLEQVAGPRIAESYGRRFRSTIQRVVAAPSSGAPRPRLGAQSRIAIVYPYILIYEYARKDDVVTLLRILHGRRNITRAFVRSPAGSK
jgi:toxin ParE1/3/4